MRHSRYDVIIAGARCAGASTALLLARRGCRVLVVDPLPRGRDTLSTHALMRGGVMQLHRWGMLDAVRAADTPAVTTTTFDYGNEEITIPIKPADGVDALFAPRRTVLDPILVDAAAEAGAEIVHGRSIVDVVRDPRGRVCGARIGGGGQDDEVIAADLVIGADGIRSGVARLVDAPVTHAGQYAAACIYGYWGGITTADFRWAYRPDVSIGLIPTNEGNTCVFVSLPARRLENADRRSVEAAFRDTVRQVDAGLADALPRLTAAGGLRTFMGTPGYLRRAAGPGWALVGDAGFFRDPITAHGITDALRDAELLAHAVESGSDAALDQYGATRDEIARGILDITDRIASFDWSMAEIRELHVALSREMKTGVETIRGFAAKPRMAHRRAG